MTHDLKIQPIYFHDIVEGKKNFEIRLNDRNFKEGDFLRLRTFFGGVYTGGEVQVFVSYVLSSNEFPQGIKPNYVVMGIQVLKNSIKLV